MTEDDLKAIMKRNEMRKQLKAAATIPPWEWGNLAGLDSHEAMIDYVSKTIRVGHSERFYGVVAIDKIGPADVCHTGNGPTSAANAAFITAARNDSVEADVDGMVAEVQRLRDAVRTLASGAVEIYDNYQGGCPGVERVTTQMLKFASEVLGEKLHECVDNDVSDDDE